MTKTMLIDASHAEETRVVVLDHNRLDDFDIETADKKQIKGNIYLAKVIRVEPSLQAAFVEYGGNRHGFLAFAEIHPDYYQIPVADRQKLLAMEAEEARRRVEAEDAEAVRPLAAEAPSIVDIAIENAPPPAEDDTNGEAVDHAEPAHVAGAAAEAETEADEAETAEAPEQLGGGDDGADEARERRRTRTLRSYKIQEVIHRRQIILIQVVKEERGSKGAALTTYVSLAGRFSVLMPNSPNGGGVSRKITSLADRRRLKEAMAELEIPDGMGMIVRTAGANRPKPEIKRDCEYLLRLWDDIREKTLASIAPALVYEEATLIKRTIRDVYTRDVDTLLIEGEDGFRTARDFMRMLMPTHAKKVQAWSERQPLFAKYQVEQMLEQMFQPTVQLRSGGYLVINQTEALVAIDVNSGRSTRERNIEDTALRTNMEAAEEVARQLRLRDLAGLIVVDFIDMESRKHNGMVERKLKDALKNDRARIQVGSISHFGLLEMSRQRLRPSLAETMLIPCPHCAGVGHVRSTASTALAALRAIEDEGARQAAEIAVHLAPDVAFYILNHKRSQLAATEARFGMTVSFVTDGTLPAEFKIEKLRTQTAPRPAEQGIASRPAEEEIASHPAEPGGAQYAAPPLEADAEEDAGEDETENAAPEAATVDGRQAEDGERRRRRRRRRRGGRREEVAPPPGAEQPDIADTPAEFAADIHEPLARREAFAPMVGETDDALEAALHAAALTAQEAPATPPAEPARDEGAEPSAAPPSVAEEAAEGEKPKRRRAPARRRKPEVVAAEPELPVFTDIADVFEAAEQAEARAPKPRRSRAKPRPAAEVASQPEQPAEAVAAPVATLVPEPVSVTVSETPEAPKAPAAQPVVIGAGEAVPVERKRGWWKRPA